MKYEQFYGSQNQQSKVRSFLLKSLIDWDFRELFDIVSVKLFVTLLK